MCPIFTDKTHHNKIIKTKLDKPINTTIQLPHRPPIELTLLHCTIGNFGLLFHTPIEISTALTD